MQQKTKLGTAALLLAVCAATHAQVITDDFSSASNWSSSTTLLGDGSMQIGGGGASFTVANPTANDFAELRYAGGVGSYDSDWSVHIDIHFATPASIFTDAVEQALGMGFSVIKTGDTSGVTGNDEDGYIPMANLFTVRANLFQSASNQYARDFETSYAIANDEFYDGSIEGESSVAGAAVSSLLLSFNSSTKVLSGGYDSDGSNGGYSFTALSFSLDVDDPGSNWNMTTGDSFTIAITGNSLFDDELGSGNGPAIDNLEVYADNFSGSGLTAVPEPSAYALCGGAAALGVAVWRRRTASRRT